MLAKQSMGARMRYGNPIKAKDKEKEPMNLDLGDNDKLAIRISARENRHKKNPDVTLWLNEQGNQFVGHSNKEIMKQLQLKTIVIGSKIWLKLLYHTYLRII